MADNPAFHAHLAKMAEVHDAKNHDYAQDGNPYSNFETAAAVAGVPVDTVFRVLIGVKLARLDELLKGKTPKHESVEDSLLDLSVYSALWASYRAQPKTVAAEQLCAYCHKAAATRTSPGTGCRVCVPCHGRAVFEFRGAP